MNFLPKNVHEISFPLGGKIPPKLGWNFVLTWAHEIDPRSGHVDFYNKDVFKIVESLYWENSYT